MSGEIRAVVRAGEMLELLRAEGPLGVSELGTSLELPVGSVHRLARTLVSLGLVQQLADRRYGLGARLVPLGRAANELFGVRARPVLNSLARDLEESANLATLSGDRAEYVAQVAGPHAMRMFTEVGRRVPLHSTGVGKAMLATLDEGDALALLDEQHMNPATSKTIVDREQMRGELAAIRQRGYAIDDEEMEVGVRCLAVPFTGNALMAVSVSGPSGRFTESAAHAAAPRVHAAAQRLEQIFTGSPA
ncbi:IclR family transcriptional regulator [Ruania alba]|uniref:Transcriptional regulator, IclR family n=1 Tax=Ruania alba TaxID=648782 RepID=A0A1H5BHH2_9MICO|nr:IclR family transcriptional regulator [Ruania alba]SED53400.1 transcriptional regulator, IclR family [Ruania alba]